MSAAGLPASSPRLAHHDPVAFSRWELPEARTAAAAELAQSAGLPPAITELLLNRGVASAAEAEEFLHPRMEHLLDPYSMRGMAEAVARVQAALDRREPILIYGDYDVDGTTAIVLLKTALEILGGDVRFHVPHRIREGYGMQPEVLAAAAQEGVRLVISVDSGIRAHAAAEAAARLGLDLIITDHHLPEPLAEPAHLDGDLSHGQPPSSRLPRALAVLNPNQPGCGYRCKFLCGAGIAFKLSQALLEASDPERARNRILPSFLKMLAIATVADSVPLSGENRALLSLGLQQLRNPVNPGLRRLMQLAELDPALRPVTATDIAFRIAPRINAAGRMDVASDVVDLFTTRDPARAAQLAEKLDRLNGERRQAEAAILQQIEQRLEDEIGFAQAGCVVIDGDGWHRGIIGILASRVVDRMRRPVVVIARENGEAHGSGRSIPGFHLLDAIESCGELFTRFGGHAQAVGFSLPSENVPELRLRLEAWAARHGSFEAPGLACHGPLPFDQITPAFFALLRRLEPFGIGNEEPVFVAYDVRIAAPVRVMKDRHLRLRLAQGPRACFSALAWDWAERFQRLGLREGSVFDVAYRLKQNEHPEFGGLELEIADIAIAGSSPHQRTL
ncbi:MAG TPA: DHHA1 domain-containing protein [Acidobacteriaceae bacterium]|nr:DHHA1 domain-containing protein [Acidobacteriaceae bacterium]